MGHRYLLQATRREYDSLKPEESSILREVQESFNDHWKPKTKKVKPTFRYNTQRGSIGIFLRDGNHERLVLDGNDADKLEEAVVSGLYDVLEKRLDRLRAPQETWI